MLPLQGIKVIDVTTNISGPTLTMILADLGAEVIKIERPGSGDEARKMAPIVHDDGTYFININRNKKSVVLDLKLQESLDIMYEMIADADVFVENFRLGKADKLGLGFERLKEYNDRLIYCSLSAYGQNGPDRFKAGYDAILQAETGLISITGSTELSRIPVSILDQGSGIWGALGVVTAILQRTKTEEGVKVDTSLFETGVFWSNYHLLSTILTNENPKKLGSSHASFAPYGAFHTKKSPVMIGISNDRLFKKLCDVLGKSSWITDVRYASNENRVKYRDELNKEVQLILLHNSADEWITIFNEAGVPASKVQSMQDVFKHPQTMSNNMVIKNEHPTNGNTFVTRIPITFNQSSFPIRTGSPILGEHTEEVLSQLGKSQQLTKE